MGLVPVPIIYWYTGMDRKKFTLSGLYADMELRTLRLTLPHTCTTGALSAI
ncbi:hypothetical protein GW17_00056808, partial [Ensete ventricosum]